MANHYYPQSNVMAVSTPSTSLNSLSPLLLRGNHSFFRNKKIEKNKGREYTVVVASSGNVASSDLWESWKPQKSSPAPSLSDVLWPSAGAFAAMAILGKMDQILAPKGVSMTIAPFGAVCAVLFASPSSPAGIVVQKYNMFMAQIGCAAIGVAAFALFGPGWLAKSAALAASIAFMIYTRSTHPPAASLPVLFIDGVKLHHLSFWYAFFPGAAGCIILSLMQEVVCYLKDNLKF
ncbi:transmembrane protein DDB_G0273707/DDB_G0273361-like [Hibiscus syriacus]|uniref:transmembrane protein DDB_G0273707/DDB_G0273361-like n=1 Tax=Hibiscus syriacus TaxID=106335 RepID=UPI00192472CD|nr:transmembrane protein DDB_G0273707/DDB_G0273361-like [Hibiscus syriacus]